MKPTLLILAAGMGSRYGGLKQIEPVGPNGETIIEYSVFDAIRAGFGKVVFVIRESFADDFKTRFESKLAGKIQIEYVYQEIDKLPEGFKLPEGREKPWGTGHAVLMARDVIHEPFATINADDFYGAEAYQVIANYLTQSESPEKYAMVGYRLNNTLSEFGSVSRGICITDDNKQLTKITETHKIRLEGKQILCEAENKETSELTVNEIVSMNFWGFHPSIFARIEEQFVEFLTAKINQPKSEFYIPFVVFEMIQKGQANVEVLTADSPWFGVTYKEDKPYVIEQIRKLTDQGVYPEKLW
ncbi:MAG TPA: sugar phosphate nucleotidyltransferase [Prolixibacteraceae bacterium]|nr:sugar phosphate nucleotidyltransferase [Prolixibacteraceae bacterium]